MFKCWRMEELPHLLVSVAFPDVDAGQVGHDERPQLLVCCQLTQEKRQHSVIEAWHSQSFYTPNCSRQVY